MIFGKHARYERQEIDQIGYQFEAALLAIKGHEYVYRTAAVEDLDAENELARLIFGDSAVVPTTVNAVKTFVETNPNISHHLYDRDRLVASIDIVPLRHEAIVEFRETGKKGWAFSTNDIEQFVPGKPIECIIIDMMTTPLVSWPQRERYAMQLLNRVAKRTLPTWGSQGVEIVSVHSSGGTPQGKQILEGAGFTYLGKRGGRTIYELIVSQSNTLWLKRYKEAFEEYKASKASGQEETI
jgi:hypothetical protein